MKQTPRKLEIITTASTLFKEKGYSAVTMRDIAKVMGIKAASLYNHIKNKEEILTFIIISLAEEFIEGLEQIKNSNTSCIDKLKQIVALHVDITSRNTNGMASLNNDWMHLKDELNHYLKLRVDYENSFRKIIKQGILKNEIKNINPDIMLFSVLSTLRSLYVWIPQKEDLNASQLASNLSEVLLKGINK
ncbi:MAG: TetR/AcrR family transcriptional regulator [Flavobacteriaceae bacterium]|nr:TetR/AcrR family transcriptional regulator [Flavobacteriaceae bacterium]